MINPFFFCGKAGTGSEHVLSYTVMFVKAHHFGLTCCPAFEKFTIEVISITVNTSEVFLSNTYACCCDCRVQFGSASVQM